MTRIGRYLLALLAVFALAGPAKAQDAPAGANLGVLAFDDALGDGPVYHVTVHDLIDKELARYIERAVSDAEAASAAVVVFHVDTFGGLVDAADQIRKTILDARVPTVAFIDKNAASAGALISYAADRIVMVPGASIGAATVVQGGTGEAAPDKYQSYMRGLMRATAEANGRDPRIAEAMVDDRIEIEGITTAGSVITLSADEALRLGVADAILPDLAGVVAALNLTEATLVEHRATWVERVLRFFASPVMQSILMLMMLGGLYFELQTPGVGFPGAAALTGALLFFAPHYMMGLVESWEIVLFTIGVILLFVEIFVLPGFGVAGITGSVLVLGSLMAALVGNVGFDFPEAAAFAPAITTMAATLVLLVVLMFSLGRYLPHSERFNRLVLAPELTSADGFTSADTSLDLMGRTGVALTPLRPSGAATFEGERVDVITAGEFVPSGAPVRVVRVRGSRVEVRQVPALTQEGETSPA